MPDDPRDPSLTPTVSTNAPPPVSESAGAAVEITAVPGYEVLGELGRGGMGVVYRARQTGLNRVVALKMILAGEHADAEQVARFKAEAEAVARLQHPNIVQVYEVGEHQGRPYFSMEYVEGGSLDRKLGGTPQPAREAAQLVETLAQAMHAAHQAGIVHRDLKPANVLLQKNLTQRRQDAKQEEEREEEENLPGSSSALCALAPLREVLPKITDFGLAKRLDDQAGRTQSGAILGTPSYMAPEQAAGQGKGVGPAADVYALGAILYECLTGRPPFKAATPLDTLLQVLSEDPVPPARLQPKVPRDLDVLCLKCLAKTPAKRYASAAALAGDLRRFLDGRPILARPAGRIERAAKWARRRPLAATFLATAALVAGLLALGVFKYTRDLATKQEQVQAQLEQTRHSLYAQQLTLVANVWERDPGQGLALLRDPARCPEDLRDFAWGFLYRLCKRDRLTIRDAGDPVALSPDGKTLATGGFEGDENSDQPAVVRLWDADTGAPRATLRGHQSADTRPGLWGVLSLAFSRDGKLLASGGQDGVIKLWDVASGTERATLRGHKGGVNSLAFTPDGRTLASAGGIEWVEYKAGSTHSELKLWDVATGRERAALQRNQGQFHAVAFSPDGKTLAAGNDAFSEGFPGESQPLACNTLELWDMTGPEPRVRAVLARGPEEVAALAFSPDGATLAAAVGGIVRLWDPATGKARGALHGRRERILCLVFSPNGKLLATAGGSTALATVGAGVGRVWDLSTGRELHVFRDPALEIRSVVFDPDGESLAGGGSAYKRDYAVKRWELAAEPESATVAAHRSRVTALAFAPGGAVLATADSDLGLAAGKPPAEVKLWDVVPGGASATAGPTLRPRGSWSGPGEAVHGLAFREDGSTLVASGSSRDGAALKRWDLATGQEVAGQPVVDPEVRGALLSPDGRTLAARAPGEIHLWDAQAGRRTVVIPLDSVWDAGTQRSIPGLAFAPDGRTLVGGGVEWVGDDRHPTSATGIVKVWDVGTGRERATFRFPTLTERLSQAFDLVHAVRFTPDSRTLVAQVSEPFQRRLIPAIRRWDLPTGRDLGSFPAPDLTLMAVSPDGRSLAGIPRAPGLGGIGQAGPTEFKLWDAATGQELATFAGHDSPISTLAFSPDGRLVDSADEMGLLKLWPAASHPRPAGEAVEAPADTPEATPDRAEDFRRDIFRLAEGRDPSLLRLVLLPWLVVLLAVYPILYVSAFCHELGHALMGRWHGFTVTSFGLGTGRLFWVGNLGGSRVYLGWQRPLQGITFSVLSQVYPTRRQLVGLLAGGVLANLVLATLAVVLWRLLPWGSLVWLMAAVYNAALAIGNLIPFNSRIGTVNLRTDGGEIWQVLRGGALPAAAPNRIRMAAALRGLWQDIGDHLCLYIHLLGAATAWRELGDGERAEALCAEAEAVPLEPTPFSRAYGAVVRAAIARARGKFDHSARALDAAEAGFRELDNDAGVFLVSWARAELLLAEGRAAEAATALDDLAVHPLVMSRPLLQVALVESRLGARVALVDADRIEALREEYERRRRAFPARSRDLRVYQMLGNLYVGRQDWARAEAAYRETLAAARQLYLQLADEADRERFARCQSPLLAEAAACLRQAGKDDTAAEPATVFAEKKTPQIAPAEAQEKRSRRYQALAWVVTGINALLAVILGVLVRVLELRATGPAVVRAPTGQLLQLKHPGTGFEFLVGLPVFARARLGEPGDVFLTALVVCVLLVLLVSGVRRAGGRFLDVLRRRGGGVAFGLALGPWTIWLYWLLFVRGH
jgi:WD40 repeat protein/predicted Ser/Thr protein kinase/tetratricopeptide (TPR) repeat protein